MLGCFLSDHIGHSSTSLITIRVSVRPTGIIKSEKCCYWAFGPCMQKWEPWLGGGDYTINRTGPAPPLAHSPPHHLTPPLSQDSESPVPPQHPQEPSCKATKMSRLCLSAALLLGTLMTSTQVGDISCKDNGKSWLISPLQTGSGMMRGVHGRGWGTGMGWTLPTLFGFLLRNWAVLTPGTFAGSQKKIVMFPA